MPVDPLYLEALRHLAQPIRAADLPLTLAPMIDLLAALGQPHLAYPSVVVAGSVGKGTTCWRLASLLRAAGLKVGLYTSPHLHLFRERMRILTPPASGGETDFLISPAEFIAGEAVVNAAARSVGNSHRYSTFELATALALWWFNQQAVDIAVLEVGLGGRFDAVNAVPNRLAVITPLEAEHVAMLGGTLESVAWHKAGIIQPGGLALTCPQPVMAVLEREAAQQGARLLVVDDAERLAAAAAEVLAPSLRLPLEAESALNVHPPARLETLTLFGRTIIIDGAHTPSAAARLKAYVDRLTDEPSCVIVGMLRDKRVGETVRAFERDHLILTTAPGDRALPAEELFHRAAPTQAEVVPALDEALNRARSCPERVVIVTGSLRMAAAAREAYGLLTLDELEEARATRAIFEGDEYRNKYTPST